MHRVFFDSNEGGYETGYLLWLPLSRSDLAEIGPDLKNGLRVIIYMPEELEFEAELVFDDQSDCWKAMPVKAVMT